MNPCCSNRRSTHRSSKSPQLEGALFRNRFHKNPNTSTGFFINKAAINDVLNLRTEVELNICFLLINI